MSLCTPSQAAPRTWDNGTDNGTWNDPSHWNGSVPQNGDDAIFRQNDGVDRFVNYVNPGGVALNLLKIECTGTGLLTLVQNQDTLNTTFFEMGDGFGAKGAFELGGGTLTAMQSFVGKSGTGSFTQTGGVYHAQQFLSLGDESQGIGAYSMAGGLLDAWELDVGYEGTGSFTQSNGNVSVGSFLALGVQLASRGTYNMIAGGTLTSDNEYIGLTGAGSFVQAAGVNHVTNVLSIGELPGSVGTYTLGGNAQVNAQEFDVGFQGVGNFIQNGGTVTTPNFNIAARDSQSGDFISSNYTMNAGTVLATDVIVGIDTHTFGTFTQNDGFISVTGDFSLAYYAGSRGQYNMNGGSITAVAMDIGGHPAIPDISQTAGPGDF